MNKLFAGLMVAACLASVVQAATVTNQLGQVMTVSKMSEAMAASQATNDLSVVPGKSGEMGMAVAHYKITSGDTGAIDISLNNVPKGAILLENAVIEVYTAITPATSTNALAVGGISVLAAGVTLNATGIKQAVATPGITTAADKIALTITGDAATAGEFTVFVPYILGVAQ